MLWCDELVNSADARQPIVAELGRLAVGLATGAAELVRRNGGDAHSVSSKSTSTDLVTEVDRASERWLVDRINAVRPGDAVLAEEGGGHDGASGVRWVLDPIDGTVNFVLGIPAYAVSVAAELDGEVVAGAVCAPVSGELFHATLGGGARLISPDGTHRALSGPRAITLERAVVGTGFAYDRARRARQGRVVAELVARIADVRRIGSAALDLCSVAAGRLDGYFEVGLNPWDSAAGGLIAHEAGCVFVEDGPLTMAAGAGLATELGALLAELGAGEV